MTSVWNGMGMQLSAEHFFKVALERMRQATLIYRAGDSYALAMYVAGLTCVTHPNRLPDRRL